MKSRMSVSSSAERREMGLDADTTGVGDGLDGLELVLIVKLSRGCDCGRGDVHYSKSGRSR